MAKTNTSKNKKPATAVRRKPTQMDRIEKMLDNVWGVMEKNTIGLKDVGQRLRTIDVETTRHLVAIQADLSLLKSGASFMQELDRVAPQEEQPKEEWVPKVGDQVKFTNHKQAPDAPTEIGVITHVWEQYKCAVAGPGWYECDEDRYYNSANLRLVTAAEIADHEAKIKAKEEEQKLARLTPGTRVETPDGPATYLFTDTTLVPCVAHLDNSGTMLARFQLSDITIID